MLPRKSTARCGEPLPVPCGGRGERVAYHLDVFDRLRPLPEMSELKQSPAPACQRLRFGTGGGR